MNQIKQSNLKLVEKLAGSVAVPKKFKSGSIDFLIKKAKQGYFDHKKRSNKYFSYLPGFPKIK